MRITVDNRVRLDGSLLPEETVEELRGLFEHQNPAYHKAVSMGFRPPKDEPRVVRTWAVEGRELSFPRGAFQRVRAFLAAKGLSFTVTDRRSRGDAAAGQDVPDHLLDLRDYQAEMRDAAIAKENCFLRAGTGGGKTVVAFGIVAKLKVPALVLLPNGGLFDQWMERAGVEFGLRPDQVGIVRGSTWRLKPLTLGLPHTLAARAHRARELNDYFGLVLMDEIQLCAARTFYASIDMLSCRHRYGISADERRKDRKEFLTRDLFGAEPAKEVSREWLIEHGHVLDVEVRVVPTSFRADWYGGDDGQEIDFHRLLEEMMRDEARSSLLLRTVEGAVRDHGQCVAFAARREHCREIDRVLSARGMNSGFLIGGDDYRQEFEATRKAMLAGEKQVGVGTYQGSGTGLDLPRVAAGVCATPIAGNEFFFNQVRGRLCRNFEGKGRAFLYYLLDAEVYDRHLDNLLRWNARVTVLRGGEWVDARHHGRARRAG